MITFARYFKPAAVITIGGVTVASLGLPLVTQLRVSFKVRRTLSSTPDSADVAISGLDPVRVESMLAVWREVGKTKLTIATGYDGMTVPLFSGDVRTMSTSGRLDTVLVASADDAGDALADATLSGFSTAGWTVQNMIDGALAALAQADPISPIVAHPSVATAISSASPGASQAFYASVNVGKASDLLNEAARLLGCRWWIRDGQLFMARRGIPIDGVAIALPETHWLSEPSDDGKGAISVVTFCDPNIVPGRQIALVPEFSDGFDIFRAEATEHAGDNESNAPWTCSIDGRRLAG